MIDDFRRSKRKSKFQSSEPSSATSIPVHTSEPDEDTSSHFETPDEVATHQTASLRTDNEVGKPVVDPRTKDHPTLRERLHSLTKKQKIIIAVVAVLLIGGGTALALTGHKAAAPKPIAKAVIKTAAPVVASDTVPSNLTGLPVAPAVNQRPVTGVMIENSDDARPQSGLDQAGVVFEAVAEAGITRFLALFQDTAPSYIGPVRSARPYYLQWCLSFDCAYAHVGGSPDALSDIPTWNIKNMDEFTNGSYFQRISSREAPHNVYTSMAQLNSLEASKGFGTAKFTSWPRKPDAPAKTLTANVINFNPSSSDFADSYQYVAKTNNYVRSEAGAPHTELDASGNVTTIMPKVVIAMILPESQGALDASGAYYTDYNALGSGPARIFQDGLEEDCTWNKANNNSPITFTDTAGNQIKLDAGQVWITILGSTSEVSYHS